ncbi:MAG: tetratricopeptide repeat protein, partial [Burkholderiaceae bacterium]
MTQENLQSLLGSAMMLLRAGRIREAIAAHEKLLALSPCLPDSWYNLAHLQAQARLFDAALASYQRALHHGVGGPEEVRLNRAVIFAEHLRRTDEAVRELEAALELSPDYVPALLNLGNIHEQRGDRESALVAYERVLVVDPSNALALSRLPNLKTVPSTEDGLIRRLREAIARPASTASDRADLGFGLGKALDSAGAYDEAFAAYAEANRASRQSAGPNGVRYDAQAQGRFVERLIAAFPLQPSPVRLAPSPRRPPVFICGMFRSGSSLVEQILASHSSVTAGGEIDLLPTIANEHFK